MASFFGVLDIAIVLCLYAAADAIWPGAQLTKYLMSYDSIIFSFIIKSTYDGDLGRAKISLRNIGSQFTNSLRQSCDFASDSYLRKTLCFSQDVL